MNVFLLLGVLGWGRISEKRFLGLLALGLGLIAGILMLSASVAARSNLIGIVAALGLLYGSYLIYRGKLALLMGWAKTRMGSAINLIIGIATFVIPGGAGGTLSVLAVASGVLGLLSA
jgi:hypothetical protein